MRNKIIYRTVNELAGPLAIFGLNILFTGFLILLTHIIFSSGISGDFILLLMLLFLISFIPILNYFQDFLSSAIRPISYTDLYIQTVDSILNVESFDEMLKSTFDQILRLMKASSGSLIFYYQERDEFDIYHQKNKKKKIIRGAEINRNSILLKSIKCPDDIIIRSRLNSEDSIEKEIMDELDRFGGEIVIPIYYQDKFYGVIVIGDKRRLSERESRLLMIFASRIAILYVNSFYFKEILKRKEIEKEYELTSKIQKQFLPPPLFNAGNISIRTYHETASSLTNEFYDIFVNKPDNDIRISAYRVHGDVKETSIFMPGIQAMLHSLAKLGYSPMKTLSKLKVLVKERDIIMGDLIILHSSVRQDGEFICCYTDYPAPFIYRKDTGCLSVLQKKDDEEGIENKLENGDIIIIACRAFFNILSGNLSGYSELIKKSSDKLDIINNSLVEGITSDLKETDSAKKGREEDRLIILIRMEGNS